jgi:hypothetical protein
VEAASFRITARPLGGTIIVNGEDVSAKVGVTELRVADGQPTTLTLHQHGDGIIEGEGIVHFVARDDRTDADIISEFLAAVDPEQLDRDLMATADVSTDLNALTLQVLASYARGEPWSPVPT